MTILRAGLLYAGLVFALGFLLGTGRVFLLAPWLGETWSVVIELPVMLAAAWIICRAIIGRLGVPATVPARLFMGGLAFAVLIAAEVGIGLTLFARPPDAVVAGFLTTGGLLGLAGQLLFAAFPLVQLPRRS